MVNFIVVVLVNMVIIVDVFNRDGVWKWLLLPTLGLHLMAACLYQWPSPVREGIKKRFCLGNSPKQRTPPTHRYGLGLT